MSWYNDLFLIDKSVHCANESSNRSKLMNDVYYDNRHVSWNNKGVVDSINKK